MVGGAWQGEEGEEGCGMPPCDDASMPDWLPVLVYKARWTAQLESPAGGSSGDGDSGSAGQAGQDGPGGLDLPLPGRLVQQPGSAAEAGGGASPTQLVYVGGGGSGGGSQGPAAAAAAAAGAAEARQWQLASWSSATCPQLTTLWSEPAMLQTAFFPPTWPHACHPGAPGAPREAAAAAAGDYYAAHPRQPQNLELAPWVAKRYRRKRPGAASARESQ
jgi:hypothetical protein